MSLFRPSDPIPPPDTAPRGDLQTASATGTLCAAILWALQRYVFAGDVPEPVALVVWTFVPYVTAYAAGHWVRRRQLNCGTSSAPPPSSS